LQRHPRKIWPRQSDLAEHVTEEFEQELLPGGLIASVLDGGQSEVGIESTIIDLSRLATHGPVLLRPGHDR
jgi:L-threonylcarbamoyladenylate synthase